MRLQKCLTFGFTSYVGWIFISNGGSKPPPYNDKIKVGWIFILNGGSKPPPYNDKINANIKIPLYYHFFDNKAVLIYDFN